MGYGGFKVLAEWGREMDVDPKESSLGTRGAGAGEGKKGPERLPTGGIQKLESGRRSKGSSCPSSHSMFESLLPASAP